MGLKEQEVLDAERLAADIIKEQMRLSRLSWSIEQDLQRLRLNAIGSSGIQHRIIQPRSDLLSVLNTTMETVRAALDKKFVL